MRRQEWMEKSAKPKDDLKDKLQEFYPRFMEFHGRGDEGDLFIESELKQLAFDMIDAIPVNSGISPAERKELVASRVGTVKGRSTILKGLMGLFNKHGFHE